MSKPILSLDFDGVIHAYTSKWTDAATIPDPPVPGALDFILAAMAHFDVQIFSSRSHQAGGIAAMTNWLLDHLADAYAAANGLTVDLARVVAAGVISDIKFPLNKPPAFLSIDARALTFTGAWWDPADLRAFKPWNKK